VKGAAPKPARAAPHELGTRTALPDALRALLPAHPREGWAAHPEFGPLTRFWLERHMGFRRLLHALREDARAAADGRMDTRAHLPRLSRDGGALLHELHGHHSIEDAAYFPRLSGLMPGTARAFDLLDADHRALHERLDAFASRANALLRGRVDAAGPLEEELARLDRFLARHLTDEEEVVVPVILELGEGRIG
jgi:iron-sulfur cluster repair protein YtfE (RIC family)